MFKPTFALTFVRVRFGKFELISRELSVGLLCGARQGTGGRDMRAMTGRGMDLCRSLKLGIIGRLHFEPWHPDCCEVA